MQKHLKLYNTEDLFISYQHVTELKCRNKCVYKSECLELMHICKYIVE